MEIDPADAKNWKVPPELDHIAPRRSRVKRAFKLIMSAFSISCLGIPILMTLVLGYPAYRFEMLKLHGRLAEGRIVRLFTSQEHNRSGTWTVYNVDYRFSPLIGIPADYQGSDRVKYQEYQALGKLSVIPVLYDPADPKISAANINNKISNYELFGPHGPLSLIIALYLFFFFLNLVPFMAVVRNYRKEKYLIENGIAAPAEILKVDVGNRNRGFQNVTYQFNDGHGKKIQSIKSGLPRSSARTRLTLDYATVLYDPQDSSNNLLYPGTYVVCTPGPS